MAVKFQIGFGLRFQIDGMTGWIGEIEDGLQKPPPQSLAMTLNPNAEDIDGRAGRLLQK